MRAEAYSRILVVDDDPVAGEVTARILERAGYQTAQAHDGPGALGLIERWGPDLIILDMVMPGMDGLEVLREIRRGSAFADVVVILLSSLRVSPEDQVRGLEAGADGYMARPVDPQELVARVRAHLRTQGLARALMASEGRFRDLLDNQPDGVLLVDEGGVVRFANPAAERLLERSAEELQGSPFGHPLVAGEGTELRLPVEGGGERRVALRVADTTWDGKAAWLATLRDETERLAAEARIREQAALLDQSQDAILAMDLEGRIGYWNASAETLFGWGRDEVQGRPVAEVLFESAEAWQEVRAQLGDRSEWRGELVLLKRDGASCEVDARWSVVTDGAGGPARILAAHTDVTEQKRLQAQFLRAQRLESVGTLAGGIAHDLNNVLAPILLSIQLLQQDIRDKDALEILDTIQDSARRGADLVKQVLAFSRGMEGTRTQVRLQKIFRELGLVVRDTFPKDIVFEVDLPEDAWPLSGDPTQVHQVLMNLMVNARDGMPRGGKLTLRAENLHLDEQYLAMVGEAPPGPYVRLTVADTGVGMSDDVRERAFEPFFSTKEVGSGTGLGLSTVAAIVKGHGGVVNVVSQPGRGTTFQVLLPAEPGDVDEEAGEERANDLRGHGELILVVDDEASVRKVTQRTLEAFGYRALTASDGAEALALFGSRGKEISLVIVDMRMPIMDGPTTIRALRRIEPGVRILASSGFVRQGGWSAEEEIGVRHFLPKPYTATDLLKYVREALG